MSALVTLTKNLLAALVIGAASLAPASATVFNISSVVLTPGAGYGTEADENGAQLLDVRFVQAFTAQNFDLSALNASSTFKIGTVAFWETNAGSGANKGIKRDHETDELGVTAAFTFTAPDAFSQTLLATGTATFGSITDPDADYVLNFAPLSIKFGATGMFDLSIGSQSFSDLGNAARDLMATLTLTALDQPVVEEEETVDPDGNQPAPGKVPEPGSLALLGLAVAAVGAARRRKQA